MLELSAIIAVLIGLGQLAKGLNLPSKYVPLMNVLIGVVVGLTMVDAPTIQEKVFLGVMMGLSASGLYDQSKIVKSK